MNEMQKRLETDLRTDEYGCVVENVNVQVTSGVRLNKFYEAELLFHNVNNVKRFALLLANDIAQKIAEYNIAKKERGNADGDEQSPKMPVFLLGYENYSYVLLHEIRECLIKSGMATDFAIHILIDTHREGQKHNPYFEYLLEEEQNAIYKWVKEGHKFFCFTIVPIGATMETFYKLHNFFENNLRQLIKRQSADSPQKDAVDCIITPEGNNYCIVAVGEVYGATTTLSEEKRKTYQLYVEECAPKQDEVFHCVTLRPSQPNKVPLTVSYLLAVDSKWTDTIDAIAQEDITAQTSTTKVTAQNEYTSVLKEPTIEPPLIKVDSTSTLLNMTYQTPISQKTLKEYYLRTDENMGMIDDLKPNGKDCYVRHGHIARADNHYEYYFDFEKIAAHKSEQIAKWVECLKTADDKNDIAAYNIILSPLHITNGLFLKLVVDNYFGSSLHLLHINITQTSKETVRTKFNYISKELRNICAQKAKVNFYYVDDSICTGDTIARGYKFLQMLCDQAEIDISEINDNQISFRFKKVFLLVNRSSFETAHIWVNNPTSDWKGFINIFVPSYNTTSGMCPGCRTRERFNLLGKRSALDHMAKNFFRNEKKHEPRTPTEFDEWMSEQIRTDAGYFQWFVVWAYYKGDKETCDKLTQYLEYNRNVPDRDCWKYEQLAKLEEQDYRIFDKCKEMVMQDHYLRLKTLDDAYKKLVYETQIELHNDLQYSRLSTNDQLQKYIYLEKKIVYVKILKMLSSVQGETAYDNIMCIVSYIKVISRDNLGKNYIIRQTIIEIMKIMLQLLSKKGKLSKKIIEETVNENAYTYYLFQDDGGKRGIHNSYWKFTQLIRNNKRNNGELKLSIAPMLQYRLSKIITHRLAMLGSDEILRTDIIKQIGESTKETHFVFDEEKSAFYDYLYMQSNDANATDPNILSRNISTAVEDYCCSIKSATMSEKDIYMSFRLLKLKNDLDKEISVADGGTILKKIYENILLENTLMLFLLMDDLYTQHAVKDGISNSSILGRKSELPYDVYNGAGSLKASNKLFNALYSHVTELIRGTYDKDGKHLRQNYLSKYVIYYEHIFDALVQKGDINTDEMICLTEMLNYYKLLYYLTEQEYDTCRKSAAHHDSLQYIYEDLCLSMARMTKYDSCYMLYSEEGEDAEIITRSGYVFSNEILTDSKKTTALIKNEWSPLNITVGKLNHLCRMFGRPDSTDKELLGKWEIKDPIHIDDAQVTSFVLKPKNTDNPEDDLKINFIVIKIPFTRSSSKEIENANRHFFVVLQKTISGDFTRDPILDLRKNTLRILFMRYRLLYALRHDYAKLIDYRFDCGYIKSVASVMDNNKPKAVKILHISDLHISDKDRSEESYIELTRKFMGAYKQSVAREQAFDNDIDLIAVTGDLINAAGSAYDAQCRYDIVRHVLTLLAIELWGQHIKVDSEKGCGLYLLPHDWKRRVLFVPGNHDYTAMNDVTIELDKNEDGRRIKAGFPARYSGGTMSKLTYYIEFLLRFLDAPIDELIMHDINEVRHYRNLQVIDKPSEYSEQGLTVYLFNSVTKSNAKQTNKVSFNLNEIAQLMQARKSSYKYPIVLTHHSLDYRPDYVEDKYMLWPDRMQEVSHAFYCTFHAFEAVLNSTNRIDDEVKDDAVYEEFHKVLHLYQEACNSLNQSTEDPLAYTLQEVGNSLFTNSASPLPLEEAFNIIRRWIDFTNINANYFYYIKDNVFDGLRSNPSVVHSKIDTCIDLQIKAITAFYHALQNYFKQYCPKDANKFFVRLFDVLSEKMLSNIVATKYVKNSLVYADMERIYYCIENNGEFKTESKADEYVQDILYKGAQLIGIEKQDIITLQKTKEILMQENETSGSGGYVELAGHVHNNITSNRHYQVDKFFAQKGDADAMYANIVILRDAFENIENCYYRYLGKGASSRKIVAEDMSDATLSVLDIKDIG